MKLLKTKSKADRLWKEYSRLKDMQNSFNENSREWHTINNYLWVIIDKYIDTLLREFK